MTRDSREDGFAIADVSSSLLDDDRMRALWRRLGNQADMCEAVVAHEAVLLGSWRDGKRLTVTDAAPLWLTIRPEIVAALMSVGLLDRTRRIPAKTWTTWFGAAFARREARRESGSRGGKATRKQPLSNAQALLNPSDRPSDRPSVPTVRPSARGAGTVQRTGPEKVGGLVGGLPPFESMIGGKTA